MINAFDTLPVFSISWTSCPVCVVFRQLLCVTLCWHYCVASEKVSPHLIYSQSHGDHIWGFGRSCAVWLVYLEHDNTITEAYDIDLTEIVHSALKERRWEMLSRGVLSHLDNAPAHTTSQALLATRYSGFELCSHTPYLPNLAQSAEWLLSVSLSEGNL